MNDWPRSYKEIMNFNRFFHFYFLNMDISVTIYIIKLKSSVYILKALLEKNVSRVFFL